MQLFRVIPCLVEHTKSRYEQYTYIAVEFFYRCPLGFHVVQGISSHESLAAFAFCLHLDAVFQHTLSHDRMEAARRVHPS